MASFLLHTKNKITGEIKKIIYDSDPIDLKSEDGESLIIKRRHPMTYSEVERCSLETPGTKRELKRISIQLGLSCNYSCSYCLQGSMGKDRSTSPRDFTKFMEALSIALPEDTGAAFEFWGGEPLLYWKILLPLATALREKYPTSTFSMATNGSLLTYEINQVLIDLGFEVTISHDGPAQYVRGEDTLADPKQREIVLDLYTRLRPSNRSYFNAVFTSKNKSPTKLVEWFKQNVGGDVMFANNQLASVYDEPTFALRFKDMDTVYAYRKDLLSLMQGPDGHRVKSIASMIADFIYSIAHHRPMSSVGQYCGRDSVHTVCLNLDGDVLTCQNVYKTDISEISGKPHLLGNVRALDKIKLDSGIHWSYRKSCPTCPILPICAGACMMVDEKSKFWQATCDSRYYHLLPLLAVTIDVLTGFLPFKIEGIDEPLPKDRELFWDDN